MKVAIIVISDPQSGGDEAEGRAINALVLAHECKEGGDEVALIFKGAGTRWPERLSRLDHRANALYNSVRDTVRGASRTCAKSFGAAESAVAAGVPLIADTPLAGTEGVLGLRPYLADDWKLVIF